MAIILDGKSVAEELLSASAGEVNAFIRAHGRNPGLAIIMVSNDPTSMTYLKSAEKVSTRMGINFRKLDLGNASTGKIIAQISDLNADPLVDGIAIRGMNPDAPEFEVLIETIRPEKDVDCFHPTNMGNLLTGLQALQPCAPLAIIRLFERHGIDVKGLDALVIGRSNAIGKPISAIMLNLFATVTICAPETPNLREMVKSSDVLIVDACSPRSIPGDWIKQGAIVVDMGQNRQDGRVCGDVDFEGASKRARAITPVPGGVGPLTTAMLIQNTIEAAKQGQARRI
jgi:methylenetetrahydrofolate dehydrogenase (NADP+)/methenyltetrahydrofolate cyclohydrolase